MIEDRLSAKIVLKPNVALRYRFPAVIGLRSEK